MAWFWLLGDEGWQHIDDATNVEWPHDANGKTIANDKATSLTGRDFPPPFVKVSNDGTRLPGKAGAIVGQFSCGASAGLA